MVRIFLLGLFFISATVENPILNRVQERKELEYLLVDLVTAATRARDVTCIAVVCDEVYLNVFGGPLFKRTAAVPFVMIVVEEYEDLFSPNFVTLESLREARKEGCNMYVILLANGLQTSRLLKFGDRYQVLDTRAKYLMLHDFRLFTSDLHYLWRRIVNVIFIKQHNKIAGVVRSRTWFELSTVPFPNSIKGVLVPRRVDVWKNGDFHYKRVLYADKTSDLKGEVLNVVYLDHVPSVVVTKGDNTEAVGGVEIEILNTLSGKMNFEPKLYQPIHAELHKWGQKLSNGSFSGLLGEMVNGRAEIALGNLQYIPYNLELTDLSIPYTSQCWTFLTPEALTDNSWKTLLLPFNMDMEISDSSDECVNRGRRNASRLRILSSSSGGDFVNVNNKVMECSSGEDLVSESEINVFILYMWIAVLLVLFITGTIFYGLARYYINLQDYKFDNKSIFNKRADDYDAKPGLYLFGEIINSILYTYGMLLVVSLPKLPKGWSIRLLTGWYWIYCILLVVSYRASMTAILANPVPRVTIDTLKELADSKITCGGWGTQTKRLFEESLDEYGQKIAAKFETIDDPIEAANKVAKGFYAYYDNSNFLKYIRVKRMNLSMDAKENNSTNTTDVKLINESERNLHIMSDCVVIIPISIGFHKNSPLKPLGDTYIKRVVEVGLIQKWLNDAMHSVKSLEGNEEEIKALMNLKKLYGAFVALAIGYFLSTICIISEIIHWHYVVKKDPKFDKYALDIYYNRNKKL